MFRQTHAQTKTVVVARCFTGLSLPHPPKPPSQTDVVNLYIGTGSDWKNLPGIAQFLSTQTNTTMFALIYRYIYKGRRKEMKLYIHLSRHPSIPPSIQGKEGGRPQGLLKLQNSTISGNCPFCPIYSRIGIHPIMKGYWPIIKISGRHIKIGMQSVRPILFFLGFGVRGKVRNFLGVGVLSSIHGTLAKINKPPPPLRMCRCLGKACLAGGGGFICCYLTGHKQCNAKNM